MGDNGSLSWQLNIYITVAIFGHKKIVCHMEIMGHMKIMWHVEIMCHMRIMCHMEIVWHTENNMFLNKYKHVNQTIAKGELMACSDIVLYTQLADFKQSHHHVQESLPPLCDIRVWKESSTQNVCTRNGKLVVTMNNNYWWWEHLNRPNVSVLKYCLLII